MLRTVVKRENTRLTPQPAYTDRYVINTNTNMHGVKKQTRNELLREYYRLQERMRTIEQELQKFDDDTIN